MKTTKAALLFYNSILIFSLVTIGLATQSYADLTSTLLLIPVGVYFVFSLASHLTKLKHFFEDPNFISFKRILRFYSLIIIVLLIFSNLATSASFLQSTLTLVLLPLILSFVLELFDKKNIDQFKLKKIITLAKLLDPKRRADRLESRNVVAGDSSDTGKKLTDSELVEISPLKSEEGVIANAEEVTADEAEALLNVKDAKRRQFLKIVGGGGVSLFLMLFVFKDKANAAFFGSAPGPGVVSVKNIAGDKIDPAEKQPTDGYSVSEVDDNSSPAYYGFQHKNGAWYIAKEDSSGAYRYVSGASSFSTSWTNRVSLTYDYFDNIF